MHRHESMSRCKFNATSIEAQVLQPWVVHGIGAEIGDAHPPEPSNVPKDIATRKYTVRYFIPTVSAGTKEGEMQIRGTTAEDAVRAVIAAHPDANITGVE